MTRRPSSIALTADDSTILCADKFGDVYSLPLIPSPEEEEKEILEREKKEQAKYTPSASVLTVHSGRNRKILEEQIKQAETKQLQARETPKFKHDLLLGHVSMLTDIVCTTVGNRSYIVTSDRDEHIRVSRGLPQAHITEGFCQGHGEFISRMCITKSKRLVSGGGDADLYVWDWLASRLVGKLAIRDAVMDFYRKENPSTLDQKLKVAVTGIWSVPYEDAEVAVSDALSFVLVILTRCRPMRSSWHAKACPHSSVSNQAPRLGQARLWRWREMRWTWPSWSATKTPQ